jgi:hypothetical protein
MTIFATASQGWPIIGIGALLLAAWAVPALLAWCTAKGKWVAGRLPRVARIVAAALIVLAGAPLYFWTLFVIVIGIAAFDCPPDAYECPL